MNDFLKKGDPPYRIQTPARCGKQMAIQKAVKEHNTYEALLEAESQVPESKVQFPLTDMYAFAKAVYEVNTMTPADQYDDWNIFSVQFMSLSPTSNSPKGMFAVRMHCQIGRFEEFVSRYGATITRVSEYENTLHVDAVVANEHMGWFEIACIYYRENLQKCKDSVFEDVDTLRDLFMIHATLKDWKVAKDA